MTAIYNRLSALWNEIEAAEEKLEGPEATLQQYRAIKEREKAIGFLLTLNETYSAFRSQILAMDPQPLLGRIFQLAVQEENQRVATAEQAQIGEGVSLATLSSIFGSTDMVAGASGGVGAIGGKKIVVALKRKNEDNPKSSRMDGWDLRSESKWTAGI